VLGGIAGPVDVRAEPGRVCVVSLEAVVGGSVGDVDILVIIGGSRIIAQVLRGRVA
jgi:hypothetical protein